MKELHGRYGDRVAFVDIVVRQAHPGERRGPYGSDAEKLASAAEYRREEGIPWTVLADDLEGTTHRAYGALADPVFLVDGEGRVAFFGMWTNATVLGRAIEELLGRGGVGSPAGEGLDRTPHAAQAFVGGWGALRRGGVRAIVDMELAAPGGSGLIFLGHLLRPLLAPLALRSTPLPAVGRAALGGGLLAAVVVLGAWVRRRQG